MVRVPPILIDLMTASRCAIDDRFQGDKIATLETLSGNLMPAILDIGRFDSITGKRGMDCELKASVIAGADIEC